MLNRAVDAGVAYVPGAAFAISHRLDDHLRLNFTAVDASDLDEAVQRLARVFTPDSV